MQSLSAKRGSKSRADRVGASTVENRSKRYNLVLPEDLFKEVERVAERDSTTVLETLRRFIKLGLLAARLQETPGAALIIRDEKGERELVVL